MAASFFILGIAVHYVIDVVLGSDATQDDWEVGLPAHLGEPKLLSRQEFFGYPRPMVLAGLGR